MKRLLFLLAACAVTFVCRAQLVIVNSDGTHSVLHGNVIINPDGSHSVRHDLDQFGHDERDNDRRHSFRRRHHEGSISLNINGFPLSIGGRIDFGADGPDKKELNLIKKRYNKAKKQLNREIRQIRRLKRQIKKSE